MEEQKLIHRILKKTSQSFNDMRTVILKVRNNALSFADTVLEFGIKLIRNNSSQLGSEQFIVLEELFNSAIDLQLYYIADKCLKKLQVNFPDSPKISLMKVVLIEAAGRSDFFDTQVAENLSQNLLDYDTKKRLVAQQRYSKTDGAYTNFVQKMNTYLEENPNDGEAWLELGDFYLENLNYPKALYCYEELILLYPKRYIYMTRVAEIYYTMGTDSDLLNARSYYSFVLNRMSNNYRSLWGLFQTCKKLKALFPEDQKNNQLLETTAQALKAFYKEKGQLHLIDQLEL
ncbi:hypothetical protein ABPG72_010789 [Tetrahymena utriculariae]